MAAADPDGSSWLAALPAVQRAPPPGDPEQGWRAARAEEELAERRIQQAREAFLRRLRREASAEILRQRLFSCLQLWLLFLVAINIGYKAYLVCGELLPYGSGARPSDRGSDPNTPDPLCGAPLRSHIVELLIYDTLCVAVLVSHRCLRSLLLAAPPSGSRRLRWWLCNAAKLLCTVVCVAWDALRLHWLIQSHEGCPRDQGGRFSAVQGASTMSMSLVVVLYVYIVAADYRMASLRAHSMPMPPREVMEAAWNQAMATISEEVDRTTKRRAEEQQKVEAAKERLERNTQPISARDAPRGAETCPVCLDDLAGKSPVVVTRTCGHALHEQCLLRWLQMARVSCPVCRGGLELTSPPIGRGHLQAREAWPAPATQSVASASSRPA